MKLLTYENQGREGWGFLFEDDTSERAWVINPTQLAAQIRKSVNPTGSNWLSRPTFREDWPDDLVGLLTMGRAGLTELQALFNYLQRAVDSGVEAGLLLEVACLLEDVRLLAPIPRPRICFGLVQNGPAFIRNNPGRHNCNLFPQGHNRPQGTIIGPDDPIVQGEQSTHWGYNVELGVVIGRAGRYIPAHRAMEHVAGYVPIMDVASEGFFRLVNGKSNGWQAPPGSDWFQEATLSWCGKMADTLAPMGPYLVTRDEIANVYDLMVYNRMNGLPRDRSHTGCYLLGIERLIHWYSSFATLEPGDVLHLGTMGVDGLCCDGDMSFGPDDSVEVEIERVGRLRNRVVVTDIHDWRSPEDPSRSVHASSAVRRLIENGEDEVTEVRWGPEQARHFWTVYGNYRDIETYEGLAESTYPRMLNTPVSSLAVSGHKVEIPPRATTLDIGVELAAVICRVACRVEAHEAERYLLGLVPMISVSDRSFADSLTEPATPQEAGLPVVYGRWADGFNIVSPEPSRLTPETTKNAIMRVRVGDGHEAVGSVVEYVHGFGQVIAFITRYVTLFPGDVVTLGRIAQRVSLSAHEAANQGLSILAEVEGMTMVSARFKQDRSRQQTVVSRHASVHVDPLAGSG